MGTQYQTAMQGGSCERPILGAVSSFWGRKEGQSTLNQENNMGSTIHLMLIFTLFCESHAIHCTEIRVEEYGSLL